MDTNTVVDLLLSASAAVRHGTAVTTILDNEYELLSMSPHKRKRQLTALQVARLGRTTKSQRASRFDFFKNALLRWTSQHQTSVVIIGGTFHSREVVQSLFYQTTELLEGMNVPLAWALSELSKSATQQDMIAQLCLQALRQNPKLHDEQTLKKLLKKCQDAKTVAQWLEVLKYSMGGLDELKMILDLDATCERTDNSVSWPAFLTSLSKLLADEGVPRAVGAVLFTCRPASMFCDAPGIRVNTLPQDTGGKARNRSQHPPFELKSCLDLQLQPKNWKKRQCDESDGQIDSSKKARGDARSPVSSQADELPVNSCTPGHEAFEIALICALTHEADALEALFDQHWENAHVKAPGDTNTYSTGKLGPHNVVLVYMPGMGTNSAANVATRCLSTFRNIRLAIVVGVCGGVPFDSRGQEIVLGDVIIGDSVIQYDFGRRLPAQYDRKDTLMDSLARPCVEIRSLIARLRGHRGSDFLETKTATYLQKLSHNERLTAKYPGKNLDTLYTANYPHMNQGLTCNESGCDGELIPRNRLASETDPNPRIHFGRIASGNTVMKSGEDRDEVAKSANVIAFEMESAGIWDVLPCIVIKGVCDYADSHKHKRWQRYAAATAASCAKAFIEQWGY